MKENIEIRFLFTPKSARRLLKQWRSEKWKLEPYSFIDHYFARGKSSVKIRSWRTAHVPKVEIIYFKRTSGVKTERRQAATSLAAASAELRTLGFKPDLKIIKKRAWLASKKGMQTHALEYVPGLGWTGEIEVPVSDRSQIAKHVEHLKQLGAIAVTKKSMLQLMKEGAAPTRIQEHLKPSKRSC